MRACCGPWQKNARQAGSGARKRGSGRGSAGSPPQQGKLGISMEIRGQQGQGTEASATVVVVATFEGEPLRDSALNDVTGGQIEELYLSSEYSGKSGETVTLYR